MATIDKIRKERIKKLENIRKAKINPYPARTNRTHTIKQALNAFNNPFGKRKGFVLCGRIRLIREHGQIVFFNFEDGTGQLQALFKKEKLGAEKYRFFLDNFDIGDFIEIKGKLIKTKTGEKTIEAESYRILAKSLLPLPEKWHGLQDKEEKYRKRYLDLLMNPRAKKIFQKRTQILRFLRTYLDNLGFCEVETPILQPIYGGASARPFITHLDALNLSMYLRISNELYLKRLIIGGLEKVYEVSKDFRNEGIDRQHNPEFTQVEFYWAYADYNDLMEMTEKMIALLVKETCGELEIEFEGQKLNFSLPWPRITYRAALIEQTGIDIDQTRTEKELKQAIQEKELDLDLKNKVGYGPILDALYKEYARPHIIQPSFLIDHPAALMPLAKRKENDPFKIESFQLLIAGHEVVKAYSELNDAFDQRERWLEQEGLAKKGLEEHEVLDQDYIEALEHGMPPTAGWGIGVDRLTTILTNQHSVRDVILFPFMRPRKSS